MRGTEEMAAKLPKITSMHIGLAEYIKHHYGYDADAVSVSAAIALQREYRNSPENAQRRADARAKRTNRGDLAKLRKAERAAAKLKALREQEAELEKLLAEAAEIQAPALRPVPTPPKHQAKHDDPPVSKSVLAEAIAESEQSFEAEKDDEPVEKQSQPVTESTAAEPVDDEGEPAQQAEVQVPVSVGAPDDDDDDWDDDDDF